MSQDKSLDEVDVAIKDLLEKNLTLREEIIKLKREKEIQSVRMCENMEKKDKANEEKRLITEKIEEKDNEIHQLSLQQANLIDQLNDANQELINLRIENEIFHNDLSIEKKTNERMMKSHESMNRYCS